MHASELVELAALVAGHGAILVRSGGKISETSLGQYWSASKCRFESWSREIKQHAQLFDGPTPAESAAHWQALVGVLEEIITGEVLTRVWTGVLCAYDRQQGLSEAEPIARSIHVSHLEARNRAMHLLVCGQALGAEEAVALNRLRRRAERWTDMLLGYVMQECDVSEFAPDPQEAREFADDLRHEQQSPAGRHAWPILLASLKAAFQKRFSPASPNADANRRIASSVLACFPPEVFDSTGQMKSLWQVRLTNAAQDTAGLLTNLLSLEEASPEVPLPAALARISFRPGSDPTLRP